MGQRKKKDQKTVQDDLIHDPRAILDWLNRCAARNRATYFPHLRSQLTEALNNRLKDMPATQRKGLIADAIGIAHRFLMLSDNTLALADLPSMRRALKKLVRIHSAMVKVESAFQDLGPVELLQIDIANDEETNADISINRAIYSQLFSQYRAKGVPSPPRTALEYSIQDNTLALANTTEHLRKSIAEQSASHRKIGHEQGQSLKKDRKSASTMQPVRDAIYFLVQAWQLNTGTKGGRASPTYSGKSATRSMFNPYIETFMSVLRPPQKKAHTGYGEQIREVLNGSYKTNLLVDLGKGKRITTIIT